jgi:hypothetical protein
MCMCMGVGVGFCVQTKFRPHVTETPTAGATTAESTPDKILQEGRMEGMNPQFPGWMS